MDIWLEVVLMVRFVGACIVAVAALILPGRAFAFSTLNQFQSATVEPTTGGGNKSTYRHVVYGDSIFAGYVAGGGWFGLPGQTPRNAAFVESEALSQKWNAKIDHQGRCVSGALADQILSRMERDTSYMKSSNVRMVSFEMCGNDYLRARDTFRNAADCDTRIMANALNTCIANVARAMDLINREAPAISVKMVMNIYYPGFDADRRTSKPSCGGKRNLDMFLPFLAAGNWATCDLARQKGFHCGDAFADFMAADYDRNGDGRIDSEAIRYVPGESRDAYVTRITQTLLGTLGDSNMKLISASESVDYLQKDDTHPTFSTAPRSDSRMFGHNRAGASMARHNSKF